MNTPKQNPRMGIDELRPLMKNMGLVATDLETVFDLNRSTVTRWLNGSVKVPGAVSAYMRLLVAICRHPERVVGTHVKEILRISRYG